MATDFYHAPIFLYGILPLLIFIARICDVTIGTLRIILVSKGQRNIAPFLGFFEVLIWILAIGQIMSNLNNWACYIGYAAGFATGNYVGMRLEERLAFGKVIVRIFTSHDRDELAKRLNDRGFGTTRFNASGSKGEVSIIYTVIGRKMLADVQRILNDFDPNLFYIVEDLRKVNAGIFPDDFNSSILPFMRWRKGK